MAVGMRSWIPALCLLATLAAPAAHAKPEPRHASLQRYMTKIVPRIRSYHRLLKDVDKLFRKPIAHSEPFVEGLIRLADGSDQLRERWSRIAPPRNLSARHRDMSAVFKLESRAFRTLAQARPTEDPELMGVESDHVDGLLRSAAYLQKRWAAALRGALRRARLPVPPWLRRMAVLQV